MEICENLRKIPENLGKIGAQRGLIWKNGAQFWQKHIKSFFWRSPQKNVGLRKCLHKKWPKNFSGKFGEVQAKILRTPQNLPAPTPTACLKRLAGILRKKQATKRNLPPRKYETKSECLSPDFCQRYSFSSKHNYFRRKVENSR